MKIEFGFDEGETEVDKTFTGLACDQEGEVWLLADGVQIFLGTLGSRDYDDLIFFDYDVVSAKYGPFTKYTGFVTLRN